MVENSQQSNLYYNAWEVVNSTSYFLYMFIGGRGIGKTYSILKGLLEEGHKFIYVRRTEVELRACCTEVGNPFKELNTDLGREIEVTPDKDLFLIHEDDKILGISGAVSTFGKFRGAEYQDFDYIFFDEFISTSPTSRIRSEEDNFFNMLETVQRNREMKGYKPIKVILASNANTIDNPIIKVLKIADVIRIMKIQKIEYWQDEERGLFVALPKDVPISKKKEETALYKLTKGTKFYQMAIDNTFADDDFTVVKKIPAKDLTPIVAYENIYFYSIKNVNKIFVSYRKTECPKFNEKTLNLFKRQYGMMIGAYIESNNVLYYSYDLKIAVNEIW